MGIISKIYFILSLSLFLGLLLFNKAHGETEGLLNYLRTHSSKKDYCKVRLLSDLGWKVSNDPSPMDGALAVKVGDPCSRSDLREARANGDLNLSFNLSLETAAESANGDKLNHLSQQIDDLLAGEGSLCAYKYKISAAVQAATAKLIQNAESGRYAFGIGRRYAICDIGGDEWGPNVPTPPGHPIACLKAKNNSLNAIQCFYNQRCRADCAIGLQVAELATQEVLYGEQLHEVFSNEEMSVGYWPQLQETSLNPFHGAPAMNRTADDHDGAKMSQKGRQYLIGASAYLGNVKGESFLDSKDDRGENMVIVDVSAEAFKLIKDAHGLGGINKTNEQLWEMHNKNTLEMRKAIKDVLSSNAIYNGAKVYVHPLGIMTLGEHVARLLKINPRTPYSLNLFRPAINDVLFEKYLRHHYDRCMQEE